MSQTFTDDDVGKTVENATGEEVGIVAAVEEGTAYVEPDPGITDSIKATLGWESSSTDAVPLAEEAVLETTTDTIKLEAEFPADATTKGTPGRDEAADTISEDTERQDLDSSSAGPGADVGAMGSEPSEAETETDIGDLESGTGTSGAGGSDTGMEADEMGSTDQTRGIDERDPTGGTAGVGEMDPTEGMDGTEEMDSLEGREGSEEMDPLDSMEGSGEMDSPEDMGGTSEMDPMDEMGGTEEMDPMDEMGGTERMGDPGERGSSEGVGSIDESEDRSTEIDPTEPADHERSGDTDGPASDDEGPIDADLDEETDRTSHLDEDEESSERDERDDDEIL